MNEPHVAQVEEAKLMHRPVFTSLTMEKVIEVLVSLFRDHAPAQVQQVDALFIAAAGVIRRPAAGLIHVTTEMCFGRRFGQPCLCGLWRYWEGAWLHDTLYRARISGEQLRLLSMLSWWRACRR